MAKRKKQTSDKSGGGSASEKDDTLATCYELQNALHARGKAIGVQALAALNQHERTALRQWADTTGEPFPKALAEKLDGTMLDAKVGAAGTMEGLSKRQRQMMHINESQIALSPQVETAFAEMEKAKRTLAQARKTWEKLVEQQGKLCKKLSDISRGDFQGELEFDFDVDGDVPQEVRSGSAKPSGTPALAQVGADIAALRARSLGDFAGAGKGKSTSHHYTLTPTIFAKLSKAKIKTIGDLKDRLADVAELLTGEEYERTFKFINDFPIPKAGRAKK